MNRPNDKRPGETLEEAHAVMRAATAHQLLHVLTALDMGHVLPVFASSPVVREALERQEAA